MQNCICAYDYIVAFGNAQLVIRLKDNTTALQLRWVQYNASESPAWFIDEIYVECTSSMPFITTLTFEETNRLGNTWGEGICIRQIMNVHVTSNTLYLTESHNGIPLRNMYMYNIYD